MKSYDKRSYRKIVFQSEALALKTGSLAQTVRLASMSEEDLRFFGVTAANERDIEKLWLIFGSWVRLFSKQKDRTSRHSFRSYKTTLEVLLESWQGQNLLRPSDNAGALWLLELQTKGNKPATIENRLAGARNFYKALRWTKATKSDPFQDLSAPSDPVPDWEKRKPYSPEEVDKLLETCSSEFDTLLVLLGAHGGLRVSEMCGLRWTDVLWQKKAVRVIGKGSKPATVQLSGRTVTALTAARGVERRHHPTRDLSYIFSFETHGARWRLRKLCQRSGVEYQEKAVHGLRHGAGTKYYAQTKDLGRVAAHLRHENIQTTRIYAKLADETVQQDVKDW